MERAWASWEDWLEQVAPLRKGGQCFSCLARTQFSHANLVMDTDVITTKLLHKRWLHSMQHAGQTSSR
jgi:hypothetical protein